MHTSYLSQIYFVFRYTLIVYPLRARMTPFFASFLVAASYGFSILFSCPISVFAEVVVVEHQDLQLDRTYCTEHWPAPIYRKIYSIATFVLHTLVPLTLITVLYYLVFRKLQCRFIRRGRGGGERIIPGVTQGSPTSSRTTKMLVAVVLVFAISWCPYHLFALTAELAYDKVKGRYFKFIDVMLRGFAVSSACLNPFLYGWFNENYRTSFYCLCTRVCCRNVDTSLTDTDAQQPKSATSAHTSKMFSRFTTSLRFASWKRAGSGKLPPSLAPGIPPTTVKEKLSRNSSNASRRSCYSRSKSPGSRSRVEPIENSLYDATSPDFNAEQCYQYNDSLFKQDSLNSNTENSKKRLSSTSSSASAHSRKSRETAVNKPTERTPLNPKP